MSHNDQQLIIAATYARVSTAAQAKESISLDEQERKMLTYAESNHIKVYEEYRFREAISGLKDERQEYGRIQQLMRERKINALIIYSSDRQTRDPIHGKIFRAELRRSQATLHSITEGGEVDIYSAQGELVATIKDTFNKYWLDKILEVTYNKKQEYIRRGVPFVQGQARYGYRRVGKKLEAKAVIDEEQAAVVRRIFEWAAEGLTTYQIDKLLVGTPAPGDIKGNRLRQRDFGVWGPMAVYRILRDEIYVGVYWANREEVYTDEDGNKRRQMRPCEEWIAVPVPPIVDRELWNRVQEQLDRGRRERPRPHAKFEYLLARRITCGACGYAATTIHRQPGLDLFYYGCTTRVNQFLTGGRCKANFFRVEQTDAAVWDKLKEVVRNPQTFLVRLREMQQQQQETTQVEHEQLAELDALIDEQTSALKIAARRQVQAEAQGHNELASTYQTQLTEYQNMLTALKERRERLERKLSRRVITDAEIQSVQTLADWAAPLLEVAEQEFHWRRRLLEAFDWRFTLLWRGEQRLVIIHWHDWDLEVEVAPPPPPRRGRRREDPT